MAYSTIEKHRAYQNNYSKKWHKEIRKERGPRWEALRDRKKKWYQENKEKIRNRGIKKKYGIEFTGEFKKQKSRCAICKIKAHGGKGWHVDHDHNTGKYRGILCHFCNVGLGNFRDNVKTLSHIWSPINAFPAPDGSPRLCNWLHGSGLQRPTQG
jgi:hypothetical protein